MRTCIRCCVNTSGRIQRWIARQSSRHRFSMDRSQVWRDAVDQACQRLKLPEAQITQLKSTMLMRPTRKPSAFMTFAGSVANGITELASVIQSQQKSYLSTSLSSAKEKDMMEADVGRCVRTCAQQIERLKQSVLQAQQQQHLSGQAVAHLHGVVLILAENLQRTASIFDGYRLQRYRQMKQDEERRKQFSSRGPRNPPAASAVGVAARPRVESEGDFTGTSLQQQTLVQENRNLVAHLSRTENLVTGVEQSVLEMSTLNQLFSTAVSSQAQVIEAIYENAVQASAFVQAGNVHLDKTIQINRSTQYYIFVLLLVATLCLLFFDWLNS